MVTQMKKYFLLSLAFVLVAYIWFALLPAWFSFSFPTGGWDWVGFIGVAGGLYLAVWNIKKQQQLSVVPCLDVDAYTTFTPGAPNNSFRTFKEWNGEVCNDGYIIIRNKEKEKPDDFSPKANIKVTNKGLSTAFQVLACLYRLEKVKGVSSLDKIGEKVIDNFYDKVHYENYKVYENEQDNNPMQGAWIISPQYNLSAGKGEFNLVLDLSKIQNEYHSILKLEYEDIYQNKYYQLMYLYFDRVKFSMLPVSKLYEAAGMKQGFQCRRVGGQKPPVG